MPLLKKKQSRLQSIQEKRIVERELQNIIQNSLASIFDSNLYFIREEFPVQNFRIDTLAFNQETKSFVIIEYKKNEKFSIIDQGYSYLALLLNNKAEFILEYNNHKKQKIKKDDVNWDQSKVIFIAHSFTKYQKQAIQFKDLPIELWEFQWYENDIIALQQIKPLDTHESINVISSKNKTVQEVSRVIKQYSIDDHFQKDWGKSRDLFDKFIDELSSLDDSIETKALKHYIGFYKNGHMIFRIKTRKNKLNLSFTRTRPRDMKDTEKRLKYMKNCMKYYNQHISQMEIMKEEDITYAMLLIRQIRNRRIHT